MTSPVNSRRSKLTEYRLISLHFTDVKKQTVDAFPVKRRWLHARDNRITRKHFKRKVTYISGQNKSVGDALTVKLFEEEKS